MKRRRIIATLAVLILVRTVYRLIFISKFNEWCNNDDDVITVDDIVSYDNAYNATEYLVTMDDLVAYDTARKPIYRRECHLAGRLRHKKTFLVIGIPTVVRQYKGMSVFYIDKTLQAFLKPLLPMQKQFVQILLFLTDTDKKRRGYIYKRLMALFKKDILAGVINLVEIPSKYYPDLTNLPLTLNHPLERVEWRSKQALDFSFITSYTYNAATYFLMTEDDAVPHVEYLQRFTEDIMHLTLSHPSVPWESRQRTWTHMRYHPSGCIGILINGTSLTIDNFLQRYYFSGGPVDLIIETEFLYGFRFFNAPIMFDHQGIVRSAPGGGTDEDMESWDRAYNNYNGAYSIVMEVT